MQVTMERLRGGFALKGGAALALVGLGDWLFWQGENYAGVLGLFALALVAALLIARPAARRDWRALIAAGLAAIYALAMVWDPSLLAFVLFWTAIGLATMLPCAARFGDGWVWFQRLTAHGFKALFGPLIDLFRLSRARSKRPSSRLGLRRKLPLLVLPVLGSAVIVALFAAANPVIESWLSSITPPEFDGETILRLILWGVLFLMAWGVLRPRMPRWTFGTFDGSGDIAIPGVTPASVTLSLILFNALFLLQNAMDAAFLWGWAELPEGMTLAEYAHRGAYPLIVTALLAALFVLVALRPGSSTARMPLARWLVAGWIAQNLFLVANSALRTWDYVEAYSLTVLRISALLWMALVAAGLVLVLWRMLRERSASWLINANLGAAGLMLSAVCFVDLGAVAAQWNVRHSREIDGTGAELDLDYLDQLGDSSLLAMIELEQWQLPSEFGQCVQKRRRWKQEAMRERLEGGGWSLLLAHRLDQAERQVGSGLELPSGDWTNCHDRHID
jgi:Domain of unknown function (DUF4173)